VKQSYVVCKYCQAILYPADVGHHLRWYPTDDSSEIETLRMLAREKNYRCPCCGGRKWIRKV